MLEPTQGSVCDRGEGTAGGDPITHGQVVSAKQVCSAHETPAGFVFVELREVSLDKQAFSWTKQRTGRTRTFVTLDCKCFQLMKSSCGIKLKP